jgi:hypothetical protein
MSPMFFNLKHFTFIFHHFVLIVRNTFSHILICMFEKVQTCLTFVNPLEIGDLLHLFNNILHLHGGLIHLKIDPKDKIEFWRFAKKIMYNNFERKKNSQLSSIASMHHPSTLGPRVWARVKGPKTFFFAPHSSLIKCLIKNYTKLK